MLYRSGLSEPSRLRSLDQRQVFISGTTKMWPIRFVEGSQPGKRKKDDIGRENVLTNQVQQKHSRFHQKLMG